MFVTQSKFDRLESKYRELRNKYDYLHGEWNTLVNRINAKGGESFLDSEPKSSQFDKGEIKQLLFLCHPDKHGDNPRATEITKKLLELRKSI